MLSKIKAQARLKLIIGYLGKCEQEKVIFYLMGLSILAQRPNSEFAKILKIVDLES